MRNYLDPHNMDTSRIGKPYRAMPEPRHVPPAPPIKENLNKEAVKTNLQKDWQGRDIVLHLEIADNGLVTDVQDRCEVHCDTSAKTKMPIHDILEVEVDKIFQFHLPHSDMRFFFVNHEGRIKGIQGGYSIELSPYMIFYILNHRENIIR